MAHYHIGSDTFEDRIPVPLWGGSHCGEKNRSKSKTVPTALHNVSTMTWLVPSARLCVLPLVITDNHTISATQHYNTTTAALQHITATQQQVNIVNI
jgi:hypothetical protein